MILLPPAALPDVARYRLAQARASSTTPRLILLDGVYLAVVRTRIRDGDERLRTALVALEQDVRKAMTVTPVSVMDKDVTPPSGDKRDYMSQAPYWWPDPAKPDGRPYIRRDGERNPEIRRISDWGG
jgi:hypothetical protein